MGADMRAHGIQHNTATKIQPIVAMETDTRANGLQHRTQKRNPHSYSHLIFDHGIKHMHGAWNQVSLFTKLCWESRRDASSILWIQDLNIRPQP